MDLSNSTITTAFLDLPSQSILSLDGQTITVQRNDFLGFKHIPNTDGMVFHLVTVRAAPALNQRTTSINVGFVFSRNLIRRYDPKTEEISAEPVDTLTEQNLLAQTQQMEPGRIIPYDKVLNQEQQHTWKRMTNFISLHLLNKRQIKDGNKIVPGSLDDPTVHNIIDGTSIAYPDIPIVMDGTTHRHVHHGGTKRYMSQLSPEARTALGTALRPADQVLEHVMAEYYSSDWEELLGDLQLSYVVFLNLQCFASFEHWRDLVVMASLVALEGAAARADFEAKLLEVLSVQILTMEVELFEDSELSGDNVLIPAFRRIVSTLAQVVDPKVQCALEQFSRLLKDRFQAYFEEMEEYTNGISSDYQEMSVDDSSDEDNPVVVPMEEIEASLARSEAAMERQRRTLKDDYPPEVKSRYPLLLSAMMHHEDILMTCARALDAANDVSLVREASAYLEEVEAKREKSAL